MRKDAIRCPECGYKAEINFDENIYLWHGVLLVYGIKLFKNSITRKRPTDWQFYCPKCNIRKEGYLSYVEVVLFHLLTVPLMGLLVFLGIILCFENFNSLNWGVAIISVYAAILFFIFYRISIAYFKFRIYKKLVRLER